MDKSSVDGKGKYWHWLSFKLLYIDLILCGDIFTTWQKLIIYTSVTLLEIRHCSCFHLSGCWSDNTLLILKEATVQVGRQDKDQVQPDSKPAQHPPDRESPADREAQGCHLEFDKVRKTCRCVQCRSCNRSVRKEVREVVELRCIDMAIRNHIVSFKGLTDILWKISK